MSRLSVFARRILIAASALLLLSFVAALRQLPQPIEGRLPDLFGAVSGLPSCGETKEFFTTLPLELDDFTTIDPLGLLSPTAHVFPAPHLYFRLPSKVPLRAPGNVTITQINLIQATNRPEFADDAAVHFSHCREFKAYFDHVVDLAPKLQEAFAEAPTNRCDEYTLTYKTGPINWKKCDKSVSLTVLAGELIGYAGGGPAQAALDFAAFDSRIEPNNFANPSRGFRQELRYNVCPLNYFSAGIQGELKARLGGLYRSDQPIVSPTCGQVVQDIVGTAKGNWFNPAVDLNRSGHEPPHLALVQMHINQTRQAFSNGDSTQASNLKFGLYAFTPEPSGRINRDFREVGADGNVYCYETEADYEQNHRQVILIEMPDPETLKIEGLNQSSCGAGPWTIGRPTTFKR